MKGLIVVDTETTGFSNQARIVELAAVAIDANGDELGAFSSLVYPEADLQCSEALRALEFCRIELRDVLTAPRPWEVWAAFTAWGYQYRDLAVSAYNVAFDKRFFDNEPHFAELPWADFCIMRQYKAWSGKRRGFKLEDAARHLGVCFAGQAHRALTDARVAAGVWTALKLRGAA